jgi:cyclohexa-1,5-dienecarbonyl-CoA hydratase
VPLSLRERDGALFVDLDFPPLNVLDLAALAELHAKLLPLLERRDLKIIVLGSRVKGAFSAGNQVRDHTRERAPEMLRQFHTVIRLIDELPQVAIAAVDGHCLGGGCELAAACDIVLATSRSGFGQPEIDVGCFPSVAVALLPRIVGRAAAELVLTGKRIDAIEAARIGLVTRVVDDLPREIERLLTSLRAKSGAALALCKRALREGRDSSFKEALARSQRIYLVDLLRTHDAAEGIAAFVEKRPPRWRDA